MKSKLNLCFLIFIVWCNYNPAHSQEFEVREFVADPTDLSAIRYEKRTVNDEPAALIKITTTIRSMQFDSNIGIVDVEHKEDGYWVYVVPRERRIRIMATGYLSQDVLLPEPARPLMVYQLVIAESQNIITPDLNELLPMGQGENFSQQESIGFSIDGYQRAMVIYGVTTVAALGSAIFFRISIINKTRNYEIATTDATAIYDQMQQYNRYSWISLAAVAPFGVLTYINTRKHKSARNQLRISMLPVQQGATVVLRMDL